MLASIISRPGIAYPPADDHFSPDEPYPEYRFGQVSARPNPVYSMVREMFAQAGLDRERFGTPAWNPLGVHIAPGSSVFVLCNFVYHRRPQDSPADLHAKCTHGSVLRAVTDYVLIASGTGSRVSFGNSALQSCDWNRVLADTGALEVARFYAALGLRVEPADLRLLVAQRSLLGRVTSIEKRDQTRNGVDVDLGSASLLAPLGDGRGARFRVTDYDPRRIEALHRGASHRYVINRRILDADVVLSLPKLKTHEKVGVTCGLKGFVGTVGHKDCLAHHRFGNPSIGGDEYPDRFAIIRPLSAFHDWINRREPTAPLQGALQIAERTAARVLRRLHVTRGGAWHGNDTAWRMALDLARIVRDADSDGRLGSGPRRKHLMVIDGIVAGEGEGPLVPTPAPAGCVLFSDDVPFGDRIACRLMGFDPARIPLIREAAKALGTEPAPDDPKPTIVFNGQLREERDLAPVLGRPFRAPSGWRRHLRRAP